MKGLAEETREEFRKRCLFEAGLTYSVGAALPVAVTLLLSLICMAAFGADTAYTNADWYLYLSFLLPQLCFAAAAFVYFYRSKEPVRAVLTPCKWYYFPLAAVMQFGLLFPLSELNGLFLSLLELLGYRETVASVPTLTGWNLLPAIIVIALLPALFEETLFRGIMSRRMRENGWGVYVTALVTGALFSLFHGNPSQTLYQFACGFCLTLLAAKAGSVYPTMLAHLLNNAAVLVLEATGYGSAWTMPLGAFAAVQTVASLCLVGALVFLVFFDKRGKGRGKPADGKKFMLGAAAGIAVCAIEWLVVFITGFLPAGG